MSRLLRDKLVAKLRQGVTLVVDRYAFSGATFTAAQELRSPLGEPCFSLDWCKVPALSLFMSCQVSAQESRVCRVDS